MGQPVTARSDFHKRAWKVRSPAAARLERWLTRLHEDRKSVHGEALVVPFKSGLSTAMVCTFDGEACGCAMCGEFAADLGASFESGFRLLHIGKMPHDVAQIVGGAGILYCASCLTEHGAWLRHTFGIEPA